MPSIVLHNVPYGHMFLEQNVKLLVEVLGIQLDLKDPTSQVKLRVSKVDVICRVIPGTALVREDKVIVRVDLRAQNADVYEKVHDYIQAFLDTEGIGSDAEIYLYPKGDGEYSRGGKVLRF